jgi:hypothetical protein
MEPPWILLAKALVCLLWSALAMLVLRLVLRQARTSWSRVRDTFGEGETRLLGLLCTAVLFIGSVSDDFIRPPLRFLLATVVSVPLRAADPARKAGTAIIAHSDPLQAMSQTARLLLGDWMEELKSFHDEFHYVQITLFFLAWFAASKVLHNILPPPTEGSSPGEARSLPELLRGMGLSRWALVFLLLTGLALCVASITTVTQLSAKGAPYTDDTTVRKKLEDALGASKEVFTEDYPYGLPKGSLDQNSYESSNEYDESRYSEERINSVELLRDELQRELPKKEKDLEIKEKLTRLQAQTSFVMEMRQQLQRTWVMLGQLSTTRYQRAQEDALTEYVESNRSSYGEREQRQHFLDIVQWHRQARHKLRNTVEQCKTQIITAETSWAAWASDVRIQLASFEKRTEEQKTEKQKAEEQEANSKWAHSLSNPLISVNAECQAPRLDAVPRRADFGTGLGPLKPIAGWLMKTESIQLALIIGMLGAGLLGSAVASFVRTQGQRQTEGDLVSVVVRGVTAAIVTFLALQGGLSTIVASNGANTTPNPHLLLLICFVAAVYSEQVWSAALQRLMKQLGPGPEASKTTVPASPAGTGPAVPAPAAPMEAQPSKA